MIERVTGTLVTVSSYHDILRSLTSMQTASKLVLYRVPSGPEFQKIIAEARRLSIEVCYDIDDPVFDLETVRANPNLDYLPRRIKKALLSDAALFKEAMQQCDLITVSTPGLKDLVERNFGNVRCRVVQNGVDTETLHVASVVRHRRNACLADGFRIVLASGSLAHGADTQVAAEGIRQFLDSHPQTEVNTIGHVAAGFALRNHKRVREFPQMAYAEYMRVLSEANAALVPLAPGTFNDCKSIVRLIDATAVGVPVIASPVGEYAEPGVSSSYLSARSPDDWCSALETLASDRVATTRVTQNARRHTYNERLLPVIWNRTDPLVQQFFVSKDIRSAPDMIQTASD
jgi:glycosyltransferase involved in cell wall biosynthesis